MEEVALPQEKEDMKRVVVKWEVLVEELKKLSYIAMPMVVSTLSRFLLRIVSLAMVGHQGELQYSSAAIATSLADVSGYSLLVGMASALETLCGQAYGAKQYQKLGDFTSVAIISLSLACVPISLLWIFMDKLLILIGQDPQISLEARNYAIWLIPSLFPFAILQSLGRYLQTQSLVLPVLFSSIAALCLHIPLCWVLVFKSKLGKNGAALAIGLSCCFNVIFLGLYVKYSSACERTRISFSKDVLRQIGKFFRLAVPSAVMICLQWWSLEVVLLLSGILPNPKLEASVLSICHTTSLLHYSITYSLGVAASTRVSNELGAGNPQAARLSVLVVLVFGFGEVIIASTVLFCCRNVLGYAFSREREVVIYVEEMTPFICLSFVMDGLQTILCGITRGSGRLKIGAYMNLVACYMIGIPVAVVLGFVLHLKAKGLWIGITTTFTAQFILFSLLTSFTNWQKQVIDRDWTPIFYTVEEKGNTIEQYMEVGATMEFPRAKKGEEGGDTTNITIHISQAKTDLPKPNAQLYNNSKTDQTDRFLPL